MQIANIFPIANQGLYADESYVMILAHLVKKGLYNPEVFNPEQYIIMDNGLFEGEQVSTKLEDCIVLACNSKIPVKEIIIPDAINNAQKTISLFKENLKTIKMWQDRFKFMFVAQAKDEAELKQVIKFINKYKNLNLSVGISKLCKFNRASREAIEAYSICKFPIHFLGIKESFSELLPVSTLIRGCDSSQLAFFDKNLMSIKGLNLVSQKRKDIYPNIPIDLEHDEGNKQRLQIMRDKLLGEGIKYEFL